MSKLGPIVFAASILCFAGACSDDGTPSSNGGDSGADVAEDTSGLDSALDAADDATTDTFDAEDPPDVEDPSDTADTSDSGGDVDATDPNSGAYAYDESEYGDFVDTSTHYRFPLDDDGWAVIEPGTQHQTIYVSNAGDDSNDGLSPQSSLATIDAARAKLRQGSSDWLLLKRGDTFSGTRFREELTGESAEHPMVIGSYSDGPRPIIDGALQLWGTRRHVAILDLRLEKVGKYCLDVLGTIENMYVENVVTSGCESRIQGSDDSKHTGVTLRRSMLLDGHLAEPVDGAGDWSAILDNRLSGVYVANVDGLFIDECYADKSGWEEGYDPDVGAGPHPPSKYSHNFYLQSSNENIVFRGTISSRAASFGAQVRPGGVVQQNVFVGNNAAFFTGGDNPSLIDKNVVTIAGNKVATQIGARGWGLAPQEVGGSVVRDNVVAHSVDPLGSISQDFANNGIHNTGGTTTEGNVVWNWGSDANRPDTLPTNVTPEQVSLLNYASDEVGQSQLEAFDDALRQRDRGSWPARLDAPTIVEYFGVYRGQ
jgi:hypothetical protein